MEKNENVRKIFHHLSSQVDDNNIGHVSNGDDATDNEAREGPFFRVFHILVKVFSVSVLWMRLSSYVEKTIQLTQIFNCFVSEDYSCDR